MEQLGPRRLTVRLPAKLPYLLMGYKTPALATAAEDWEAYALEVAAGILDGGSSSRLTSRLVRGQQIAASAEASYDLYSRLSNLFTLAGTPAQGRSLAELEHALGEEVRRLRDEPVAAEELERVKAQVLAGHVYQLDSMFYQAMELGTAETVGLGWRKVREYVDKVNAVTAEQVRQVAQKYLIEDGLTVAYLEPCRYPKGRRRRNNPPPREATMSVEPLRRLLSLGLWLALLWLAETAAAAPDIQHWTTARGGRVYFVPTTGLPWWTCAWCSTPAAPATAPNSALPP